MLNLSILLYGFFIFAVLIIIHHYIKHRDDKDMTLIDKFVQYKDINNHETWALFFIGISIGLYLSNFTTK